MPDLLDDLPQNKYENVLQRELKGYFMWTIGMALLGIVGWYLLIFYKYVNINEHLVFSLYGYTYVSFYGFFSVLVKTNKFSLLEKRKWTNVLVKDASGSLMNWMNVFFGMLFLPLLYGIGISFSALPLLLLNTETKHLIFILLLLPYMLVEAYCCYHIMKKRKIESSLVGKLITVSVIFFFPFALNLITDVNTLFKSS